MKDVNGQKSYYECLNQINNDELFEGLLGYGMFAEKIPNFLSSVKFFEFCRDYDPEFDQKTFKYIKYENMRNINIPRILAIPNPFAYYKQCKILRESFWELKEYFREKTKKDKYKISRIHIRKIKDKNELLDIKNYLDKLFDMNYKDYHIDGNPEQEIFIGKKYKVKADISTCFPSIYTHAIPWALIGKNNAKGNRNSKKEYYNMIDSSAQWLNNNETHGILIGPHSSNLVSEIILIAVDAKIKDKYQYIRHIDDYSCYVETREKADKFLLDLSQSLKEFGLLLNHKKTEIIELPNSFEEDWARKLKIYKIEEWEGKIKYSGIAPFMDLALDLMKENKNNASILTYAIKMLLKKDMTPNAIKYFIDIVHHLVLIYSYLIFLLEQVFDKFIDNINIGVEKIQEISLNIFKLGQENKNYEAMSYAIYFALKYRFKLMHICVSKEATKKEDCTLMLLCYLYDKRHKRNCSKYIQMAENFIDDTNNIDDEFWLFSYEVLLHEKPQSLNKCKDWKKLKEKKISFLKDGYEN